ncbi:hypothetical protein ACSBR1_008338 [Camellia fascicularis]
MVKGKKQWLKLGDLRSKKLTEYEKQRNKKIKENYEVMNNLGVKNITNSLVSAVQPKCANAKEKGIRIEVDDDEYKPSESKDDNNDESLGSFSRESHSRPLTPTPEEGMDPPSQEVGNQPLRLHNVQPEHEEIASSMLLRALIGDEASKLASKIGIEVQTQLPDLSVRRWKKVNDADKEPMIQHLAAIIVILLSLKL